MTSSAETNSDQLRWEELSGAEQVALEQLRVGTHPLITVEMADRLKGKGLAEATGDGTGLSDAGRVVLQARAAAVQDELERSLDAES